MKQLIPEAPILCIDFDGTLTDGHHFGEDLRFVPLMPGCKEALTNLSNLGCTIILWTCRHGARLDEAVEYLKFHNVPIDLVNRNVPWYGFEPEDCGPKVFCDYYIDDRNIGGLPSWDDIERIVLEHPYFRKKAI